MKELDPTVWLPHFWFFLYSTAHCYPDTPNSVTKRKYYDFVLNLPLYFPNATCSNYFSRSVSYTHLTLPTNREV